MLLQEIRTDVPPSVSLLLLLLPPALPTLRWPLLPSLPSILCRCKPLLGLLAYTSKNLAETGYGAHCLYVHISLCFDRFLSLIIFSRLLMLLLSHDVRTQVIPLAPRFFT